MKEITISKSNDKRSSSKGEFKPRTYVTQEAQESQERINGRKQSSGSCYDLSVSSDDSERMIAAPFQYVGKIKRMEKLVGVPVRDLKRYQDIYNHGISSTKIDAADAEIYLAEQEGGHRNSKMSSSDPVKQYNNDRNILSDSTAEFSTGEEEETVISVNTPHHKKPKKISTSNSNNKYYITTNNDICNMNIAIRYGMVADLVTVAIEQQLKLYQDKQDYSQAAYSAAWMAVQVAYEQYCSEYTDYQEDRYSISQFFQTEWKRAELRNKVLNRDLSNNKDPLFGHNSKEVSLFERCSSSKAMDRDLSNTKAKALDRDLSSSNNKVPLDHFVSFTYETIEANYKNIDSWKKEETACSISAV